jgi:glycerol-3-phosphate acyltransferase PlsY
MLTLLSILLAYLIGSISVSTLLVRVVKRVDIRSYGSGNAGATNTLRLLGWKYGILVLLLDALKGAVSVYVAYAFTHHSLPVEYVAGLAVIVGHNWPIFFGFRGGKGIATTIGVFLVLLPLPALLAGIVALIVVAVTRFVSLGAISFVVLSPIFLALLTNRTGALLFSAAAAVLAIYRHRENLVRLARGKERRLFDHS